MDHKYINEFDLVDRYLTGKLPEDEGGRFEEHFVDCKDCVERIEATRGLIQGLRLVATADAHHKAQHQTSIVGPWYSRRDGSRKWFALAAGLLLLMSVAGIVVFNRMRLSRMEGEQAKSASTEWQQRYEEEHQAASLAESQHQVRERELTGQLNQLQSELEKTRERIDAASQTGPMQPQINMLSFELKSLRGSSSSDSANILTLPKSPTGFMILVPLEGETGYGTYTMTIRSENGQSMWSRRGFKPNQYNALSAGFNSAFFRNGNYVLTVEGIARDGNASVIGTYPITVRKSP
jgi:hypothetical protein